MNSAKIVEEFWERVWRARNPAAIDNLVVDDVVLTTGGVDVVSTKRDLSKLRSGHVVLRDSPDAGSLLWFARGPKTLIVTDAATDCSGLR
jgi:hypothetical protein